MSDGNAFITMNASLSLETQDVFIQVETATLYIY